VATRWPSKNAVFMLQTNQIVPIEIEKFCSTFVRGEIFLLNFHPHTIGIFVARFRIVHRDCEETSTAIFRRDGRAEIRRKRRNAALPGEIVSDNGDARGQRQRCTAD
jgi:hypothetical protein